MFDVCLLLLYISFFLMSLKIISFNCQSLNVNFDIVSLLSKRCDVLLLQETLLNDSNKHILDNIDPQFNVIHVPSVRKSCHFIGRFQRGLSYFMGES